MGLVRILCAAAAAFVVFSSAAAEPRLVLAATEPGSPAVESNAAATEALRQTDGNDVADPALPAAIAVGTPEAMEPSADAAGAAEESLQLEVNQASDPALPAAVAAVVPAEMEQAAPLEPPEPTLFADIDLTTQRITVSDASGSLHKWKISSARGGYVTPVGTYKVNWTSRMHYSKQYHYSPMPYSVFFHRGYAVHGTNATGALGRPASHGCVRLHTRDAKTFYNLVEKHGGKLTKITVRGTPPYSPVVRDRRRRPQYQAPGYQPFGFFSAYSYQPPRQRRGRRRRYGGGYSGAW